MSRIHVVHIIKHARMRNNVGGQDRSSSPSFLRFLKDYFQAIRSIFFRIASGAGVRFACLSSIMEIFGLFLYELEVSIREKKAIPNDTHHR